MRNGCSAPRRRGSGQHRVTFKDTASMATNVDPPLLHCMGESLMQLMLLVQVKVCGGPICSGLTHGE